MIQPMTPPYIIKSTTVHSNSCVGVWHKARSPEILGSLSWICASLQLGISCSLAVYDTDQGSLQSEGSFLSRENTTKIIISIATVITSNERELGSSLKSLLALTFRVLWSWALPQRNFSPDFTANKASIIMTPTYFCQVSTTVLK